MNALCNGNLKQGDRPLSRSAANTQAAGMHAIGTNTGFAQLLPANWGALNAICACCTVICAYHVVYMR